MTTDTIAAISTPHGEGGIGIVRISGPAAFQIAKKICRTSTGEHFSSIDPHKATYGCIIDPVSGRKIDEIILLAMPGPRSYTCEDVIEINCHGGIFIVHKVLSLAVEHGARIAGPGEFTKRAFLNGRIDLAKAEAVIDLIKADSDAALKTALTHLEGRFSSELTDITDILINVSASIEASIDFPEEDIETSSHKGLKNAINAAIKKIEDLVNNFFAGRVFRDGIGVVIAGRPNVGKSSLLNALLMEDRAIVTPYPGTTRDIIEESITIDGMKFRIKDTAGLRTPHHKIEEEGIQRTKNAITHADIIIFMIDRNAGISAEEEKYFGHIKNGHIIVAMNKTDLEKKLDMEDAKKALHTGEIVEISAKRHTGLDMLRKKLKTGISHRISDGSGSPVVYRLRHQRLLTLAKEHLTSAAASIDRSASEEFIAIDINSAVNCIEEITGKCVSEDILDKIFSEFCIGK